MIKIDEYIRKLIYSLLLCIFISVLIVTSTYSQEGPRISLSESVWDIGELRLNEEVTHNFKITNTGTQPLEITQLRSSCSCLKVEITSNTIQPNESAEIKAIFKEDQRLGDAIKTIYIDSNDPETQRLTIRVKATIIEEKVAPKQEQKSLETQTEDIKREIPEGISVGIILFYSEDCADCKYLREKLLPRLAEIFGDALKVKSYPIDDVKNYDLLVSLEKQFEDTGNEIPVVFIGKDVLGGKEANQKLPDLVERYISQGGVDFPELTTAKAENIPIASDKTIYMAYFEKPGCKSCDRANYILKNLGKIYPNLQIKRFNSEEKENTELFEALCSIYDVPEKQRLVAPAIFLGEKYLIQDDITDESLRNLIAENKTGGTKCPWEEAAVLQSDARNNIIKRFKSLKPLAIVAAGLIDGINPCAFATIVLFMSYLSLIGRKGRELIYVGLAFTIAVFLTYFLVGFGVFQFIQILSVFAIVSRILYILIAILAFVLGVLSLYDFIQVKRGKAKEMFLQLPGFLKDRIHKTIRKKARTERFIIAAFVTGAIISILELACTGQVYLPTICFVVGVPELKSNAVLYLLLYNFMFIIPLIIIFIVTYFGTTFTSLAGVLQRHLALIKLLMSILFFGLCGFLISTLF